MLYLRSIVFCFLFLHIQIQITLITIAVLLFQSLLHIEAPPTQIFVEIYTNLNVYLYPLLVE